MIYFYKMLYGLVGLNFYEYFTLRVNSTIRGHEYKLFSNYSRLNVHKHFFSESVITMWNNVECNITYFSSVYRFKKSLLLCDLSKYILAFLT